MKYLTIICLGLMLSAHTDVSAQDAMSVWDTTGITIDGHIKEWPSFFRFYISGAKIQFDFYNDSTSLYLCMKAVDMEAQSRLMNSGIELWFDPAGKKKRKTGITFPLKLEGAPGDMPRRSKSGDPDAEPSEHSRASRLRQRVLFAQSSIKVVGMPDIKEPEIPLQNKYGIEISYDWDSLNILAVEYKIPLSLIYQHPITSADLQQPMGLGIIVGAVETQHTAAPAGQQAGAQGQQRGAMGGGSGMGGGGGRGGARGGSSQNNLANDRYSADSGEQKVWLKVHWETKPAQF
jgi:hypothetical protein